MVRMIERSGSSQNPIVRTGIHEIGRDSTNEVSAILFWKVFWKEMVEVAPISGELSLTSQQLERKVQPKGAVAVPASFANLRSNVDPSHYVGWGGVSGRVTISTQSIEFRCEPQSTRP